MIDIFQGCVQTLVKIFSRNVPGKVSKNKRSLYPAR
jgi:hypothetical protein